MAFTLVTAQTILARNAGVLYGLELGTADMSSYALMMGATPASQSIFLNSVYTASVGTASVTMVAQQVLTGLGIPVSTGGTSAWVTGLAYVIGQLNAATATKTQGSTINDIISAFTNLDVTDPTWGPLVTAFNNRITNALAYSATTGSATNSNFDQVSTTIATASGSTFTLTTGTDNLIGTSSADSFNGVVQDGGATGTTAQPGDAITGGAGADTLTISVAGTVAGATAYTISALQTTDVEKVVLSNYENSTNNTIVAADLMSGLQTVGLASSSDTGDTQFTGLKTLVTAEMKNGAADLTLTYNSSVVTGSTDAQTLNVSNLTGGTFTAQGIETLTVNSAVAKSTITELISTALTKVVVTGSQDLTVSNAIAANTVDAAAFTGVLTVKAGANAAQVITGGAGNDVVEMNTNLGSGDTITGGAGTDTLKVSLAAANSVGTSVSKGAFYKATGFEVIDVASTHDSAALDLTGLTGVTNVVAAANVKTVLGTTMVNATIISFILNGTTYTTAATDASADATEAGVLIAGVINAISGFSATSNIGTVTITSLTGEAIEIGTFTGGVTAATIADYKDVTFINLAATTAVDIYSADAVNADLADASSTADVLNINLKTTTADKGFNKSVGTITATNIETINLSATGMSDLKTTTIAALTDVAMKTLNITGDSDIAITAFTSNTNLATIDGSTSTGDLSLAALGAAKDQSIKTGAGNDTINMAGFLTNADTIDGGANSASDTIGTVGKDTLTATVTSLTATTGALNIANVERINLTNAGTAVLNAAAITGASEIAFAEDAGMSSTTVTGLAAGVAIGLGLNGTANQRFY